MSGILTNFTFNGEHCLDDHGLLFVEDSGGRVITHARRINEYEIAGASGTIRFPGEAYEKATLSGALYPMESPADEAAAQALMRGVAAWLYGPRGRLIFDYEPDKYRLAEITGESKWSCRDWLDGGLDIAFDIQPFAWAVAPVTASHAVTSDYAFTLDMGDSLPAPLEATITNSGEAALTGAAIQYGANYWIFEGMSIPQNGALAISCEAPIGAVITAGGQRANALPYAQDFDRIELSGTASVGVTLTFASGARGAAVALQARGRWL